MWGTRVKKNQVFHVKVAGFILCQQNGQRTYGGPPPNWGNRPTPSRDCEVFIGRLPRVCFEDELIPLFLTAGELYEFRLMLDFSGTNRGYAYAHYATLEGAQRAIKTLHMYEIRPGHTIGVLKSKNNCRLLFGNISSSVDLEGFNEFIRTITDQVLTVLMFKNFNELRQTEFCISSEIEAAFLGRMPRNNGNNKFAIVEYENHKAAAVARRILVPKYGHMLAIDWAVPPRERKRYLPGTEPKVSTIERPLSSDSNLLLLSQSNSKIRPVPVLMVQPSPLDKADFIPGTYKIVIKFFKYQLSVCLYKSVDHLEIPLYVCKEIERKIVDRITNFENCSQAVQLIFNYFSWYNEKKRITVKSEIQKLLQEVKTLADSFACFIKKRMKYGPSPNLQEDNYYTYILPIQLSVLFKIILRSDFEYQSKLSSGITKSLDWLKNNAQTGNKLFRDYINEVIDLVNNEDGASLDKASTIAKAAFLNKITSRQPHSIGNGLLVDTPLQKFIPPNSQSGMNASTFGQLNGNQKSISPSPTPVAKFSSNLNSQHLKGSVGNYIPIPFSQIGLINEESPVSDHTTPVPLLAIQPSIMNKVPFMPDMFNNVLLYFKHLIRICLNKWGWQLNIPRQISSEIERKIIDRISNMENCSEGVHLILNYFTVWILKNNLDRTLVNCEPEKLLQEVKYYADSFVNFVFTKTMRVYIPDDANENLFCRVLPLKLNLLFHIMLIFNDENPTKFPIGITKGLNWLEDLTQKGDKTAKLFLEELTRFVIESDETAYERAKKLGKKFYHELMNTTGEMIGDRESPFLQCELPQNPLPSSSSGLSATSSDNSPHTSFDCDS